MDRLSTPPPKATRHPRPSGPPPDPCVRALEHAADLAVLAPSVHNTQPWRIVMHPDRMELWADRTRQLAVLDPTGRELVQSGGAALFNARVALADEQWAVEIERFPRPDAPDLLAVVRPVSGPADPALAALEPAVARRHTNRRRFTAEQVPDDVVRRLTALAAEEGTTLVPVLREGHRRLVARLTQQADGIQNASPAYRAELRHWTTRPAAAGDGVPSSVVPHVDGLGHDDVPIRDFDTQGQGELPAEIGSGADQTFILLATGNDDRRAWLCSGEALQRVLLELTGLGWVASPLTQAIEVPVTRTQLRAALTWHAHPQMLLRVGRADGTDAVPHRPRDEAVVGSWRPLEQMPVSDRPIRSDPAQRRPVPDGRGGTTWI
jgi:nitroreductase